MNEKDFFVGAKLRVISECMTIDEPTRERGSCPKVGDIVVVSHYWGDTDDTIGVEGCEYCINKDCFGLPISTLKELVLQ